MGPIFPDILMELVNGRHVNQWPTGCRICRGRIGCIGVEAEAKEETVAQKAEAEVVQFGLGLALEP